MPLLKCVRSIVWPSFLCVVLAGCGSRDTAEGEAPQPLPASSESIAPQVAAPVKLPAIDCLSQIATVPQLEVQLRHRTTDTSIDAVEAEMVSIAHYYQGFHAPVLESPFCAHSALSYCRAMMTLEQQRQADLAWLLALEPAQIAKDDAELAHSIGQARHELVLLLDEHSRRSIHSKLERSRENLRLDLDMLTAFLETPIAAPRSADRSQWLARCRAETRLVQMINTALLIDRILNVDSQFPADKLAARELIQRHCYALQQQAVEIGLPASCAAPGTEAIAQELICRLNQSEGPCESLIVLSEPATARCVEYFVTDTGVTGQACQRRTFEVATIEKANGRRMLFTHLIASFEHGNHRVTADRWYVAERRGLGIAVPHLPTLKPVQTAARSRK